MKNQGRGQCKAQARERLWSLTFVIVIALTLCCFMVGQGLNASTSVYVALYGGTATYSGVLAAVFSAAAAVARFVSGPLIDSKGRRIVMLFGSACLIAGTIGPAFTHDTAPFVVFRILQGFGFAAATTAAGTAAADVLPASRMGEGISYYGLGQALAMSVGPALALFLVSMDPAENLFFGLTAIATLGFVLIVACRYERHPELLPPTASWRLRVQDEEVRRDPRLDTSDEAQPKEPLLSRIFEPGALAGALPMLVLSPSFGFSIFFVGLYGATLGVGNSGLFFTLAAVTMVLSRLRAGAFMDRTAPLKVFIVAAACGVVAFLMLLASGTLLAGSGARDVVFYLAGIMYGLCIGIALPLNQSVAVKNSPQERWGAANALFQLANDIGIGVACVVWGIVNDCFGFSVTICCVICCILASVAVAKASYPKG